MQRQQQQQQPQNPQQCDYNDPLVLKLKEADDFGAAVQAVIRAGEGSSQVHDFLLLDVTPLSMRLETTGGIMTKLTERLPVEQTKRLSWSLGLASVW